MVSVIRAERREVVVRQLVHHGCLPKPSVELNLKKWLNRDSNA